jgi:hypothetical protein
MDSIGQTWKSSAERIAPRWLIRKEPNDAISDLGTSVGTVAAVENGDRRYYLPFILVIIMPT